ncbi:XRE family transcriptional regulator, partial [Bacillus paralicheniformis]|nr:XRE family transcriptional regulator [Bacillus paralicheniformis]
MPSESMLRDVANTLNITVEELSPSEE